MKAGLSRGSPQVPFSVGRQQGIIWHHYHYHHHHRHSSSPVWLLSSSSFLSFSSPSISCTYKYNVSVCMYVYIYITISVHRIFVLQQQPHQQEKSNSTRCKTTPTDASPIFFWWNYQPSTRHGNPLVSHQLDKVHPHRLAILSIFPVLTIVAVAVRGPSSPSSP